MRIAGQDQATRNLVKWSARDDWAPCREQVFASHLDSVMDEFDITGEALIDILGDSINMLYGVMLEDFFTTRFRSDDNDDDDDGRNVIDDYLKRRGWREKVPAKRYLEAVRDSVISLYEIIDLNPGQTMTVRDMIRGGDPVTVAEKQGSQDAARWDRIAARLVTVNNQPFLTGGILLLPYETANKCMDELNDMAKSFRAKLRREAKKQGKTPDIGPELIKAMILADSGAHLFTQTWLADTLEQVNAPLPQLYSSDGDNVLFSEVRFPITGDMAEVIAAIDNIENVERNAPTRTSWTWHDQDSAHKPMAVKREEGLTFRSVDDSGRICLGNIEIQDDTLLLSAISKERAEKGRDLLASHLGALVGAALITHEDIQQMSGKSIGSDNSEEDDIPAEIAARIIHDSFDDHYRKALENPLPMLNGKTPRQAVKTRKGRAQVIEWLKFLENSEHRRADLNDQAPYDMAWMWRELNLEGERYV